MNYVKFSFWFIGYAGDSLAIKIFGTIGKRIDDIIDKKTTVADETMGMVGSPTPLKYLS